MIRYDGKMEIPPISVTFLLFNSAIPIKSNPLSPSYATRNGTGPPVEGSADTPQLPAHMTTCPSCIDGSHVSNTLANQVEDFVNKDMYAPEYAEHIHSKPTSLPYLVCSSPPENRMWRKGTPKEQCGLPTAWW